MDERKEGWQVLNEIARQAPGGLTAEVFMRLRELDAVPAQPSAIEPSAFRRP